MNGLADQWADFARGATLGLAVAAPIGPISMLCIQRTLTISTRAGLATGYGVASTHMLYASIAAAGLVVVVDFMAGWGPMMQVLCAVLLLRMAVRTAWRRPALHGVADRCLRPCTAYATGLSSALSNPTTLMGFFALTPSILGQGERPWQDMPVVAAGVLMGSAAWWTVLVAMIACARRRLSERGLRLVNLAAAASLAGLALVVLVGTIRSWPTTLSGIVW